MGIYALVIKTWVGPSFPVFSPAYSPFIVELRTPAMPVGVGGGKERGGFHLNLRT